jgi:hypothetical protein
VVVAGWAAVRAITLGTVPGFTVGYAKEPPYRPLPPIVATQFPPLPAVDQQPFAPPAPPYAYPAVPYVYAASAPAPYPPYAYANAAYPAQVPIPPRPAWQLPRSNAALLDFAAQPLGDWQLSSLATFPERQSRPVAQPVIQPAAEKRIDRLQLSSWALLRGAPAPGALATGGTLGGSQAGARLTYAFNPVVAASLRTTSPIGGSRGAEIAGGVRVTPFRSIPVAFTAERRQSISRDGGRSAFALFAEGGLYKQPMPMDFSLDAYVQAGVVGFSRRDLFVDGAFAFTRPVWGRVSAGFGMWGGAQPGLYRVDVGPRVSVRVRDNVYAHVDWRQRVAGAAAPASGPALTLAADF